MRLSYAQIKNQPQKLLALTDLTRAEFDNLLAAFNKVNSRSHLEQINKNGKTIAYSTEDQLLLILVYLQTFPALEITCELFGAEASTIYDWAHRLLPVVCNALDELGAMPERNYQRAKKAHPSKARNGSART